MECEYEDMEFEYTNPQPFVNSHYNSKGFTLPPSGTFSIPSSFFEDQYKKSNIITNTVCSLLDKFSLNEEDTKETAAAEENFNKMPESPPSTPPHNQEEITENSTALVLFNRPKDVLESEPKPCPPVSPTSPVSLPLSYDDDLSQDTPYNQHEPQQLQQQYQRQQQQQPSHTYVYNAAPSVPVDHLGQSHGALYFITGLVKLICKALLFVGIFCISSQLVLNFHHDMKNKIAAYESDLMEDRAYCQQQYDSNRCTPDTRLPAVKELCRNWDRCILRPISVSKTKVFGETFAELFNGFVDALSVRTMIYTGILGLGLAWSLSSLFSHTKKPSLITSLPSPSHTLPPQQEDDNIPHNPSIKRLELQPLL